MRGIKTIVLGAIFIALAIAAATLGTAAGGLANVGGITAPATPTQAIKGLVIAIFITGLVLIVIGVAQLITDLL